MTRWFAYAAVAAVSGLIPRIALAQDVNLGAGGYDQIWTGVAANANAGRWLDKGAVSAGDDRPDLIIGTPGDASRAGAVYVVFGGPVRTGQLISLSTADVIIAGASNGDGFGSATAAGNTRSTTGRRDLIVGAPNAMSGRGIVYLFAGGFTNGQSLTAANAVFRIIGAPGDQLGSTLASADLNNDGIRDIVAGAPGTGRVYVINGAAGLSGTRDLSTTAANVTIAGPHIGRVLASADVTGDGIYELLVGAPNAENAAGRVFLIQGRNGGLPSNVALPGGQNAMYQGIDPGDRAGAAIHVGDFDNDQRIDIIIGAPGGDGPSYASRPESGEVYLLWGAPSFAGGSFAGASVTFYAGFSGYELGSGVEGGDINRDPKDDIVMIAAGANGGRGELEVYYGRSRSAFGRIVDLSGGYNRRLWGDQADGPLSAAVVYEVTGEGARDIIVGAPAADTSAGADSGKVFFSLSPKLAPTPRSTTLRTSPGGSASFTLEVRNPGAGTVPWSATTSTPWLSLSTTSGSSTIDSTGTVQITANAAGLDVASYTGTVTIRSLTNHLEMFVDITVNLTVSIQTVRVTDVDGDGVPDATPAVPRIVLGLGPLSPDGGWFQARAGAEASYNTAVWIRQPWSAYNNANGEVHPAVGDVDGDGLDEVVLGFGSAGRGFVLVLDDDVHNFEILRWIPLDWDSYASANGETWPAVGNIDSDPQDEIVIGLGPGSNGWFRIIDDANAGFAPIGWRRVAWDSYNASPNASTRPAVGDLDGNGEGEIVLGLGSGSNGWLEIVSGASGGFAERSWVRGSWSEYNSRNGSTWPAVGNIDADARAELVLGFGRTGGGWLEVLDDATANHRTLRWIRTDWQPYDNQVGETHPAIGNVDGDAAGEIVIGLAPFSGGGGWFVIRDDANAANAHLAWKRVNWAPYDASGGPTFPAVGRLR